MWQELQPDDPGRIGPYRLRGVLGSGGMGRVPAEARGLIQRCLAKDPGQRPSARDLEFAAGAGAVPPTERWVPEAVTRTFLELPDVKGPSGTVTSARLSPVSQPAHGGPGRHAGRRRRRLARPLTIASMVVGLLAASAAGGIALAASVHQMPGAHSGQAAAGSVTSPASSASARPTPSTSPTAIVASSMSAPATAPATASASATPTAAPNAATSPSVSPTMSSSPAPTGSPSGSASPAPSGSTAPTPAAS